MQSLTLQYSIQTLNKFHLSEVYLTSKILCNNLWNVIYKLNYFLKMAIKYCTSKGKSLHENINVFKWLSLIFREIFNCLNQRWNMRNYLQPTITLIALIIEIILKLYVKIMKIIISTIFTPKRWNEGTP